MLRRTGVVIDYRRAQSETRVLAVRNARTLHEPEATVEEQKGSGEGVPGGLAETEGGVCLARAGVSPTLHS